MVYVNPVWGSAQPFLRRSSVRFERTGTIELLKTGIRHNTEFAYTAPHTRTFDSTPVAAVSPPRADVTWNTESGESWVDASSHVNTAIALGFQLGGFLTGQHRIPYMPIVHEHGVVVPHAWMVAA